MAVSPSSSSPQQPSMPSTSGDMDPLVADAEQLQQVHAAMDALAASPGGATPPQHSKLGGAIFGLVGGRMAWKALKAFAGGGSSNSPGTTFIPGAFSKVIPGQLANDAGDGVASAVTSGATKMLTGAVEDFL